MDDGSEATREVIERVNAAFNAHDVAAVMALMTTDCVFENTWPPPDGERFQGQAAVSGSWERLFAATPDAYFSTEELITAGDRAVVRWRYTWTNADGSPGHVRGIDLFRVRDGKVAEKLSYVKG
ncbi:MAG: nuclear transport factor 2 family protein [Chloroflexota bacterium]